MSGKKINERFYGIGYIGEGDYSSKKNPKIAVKWRSMLERGYSEKYHKKKPTYIGCTVAEEWKCFQNFAKWYEDGYVEGWELDKDILSKGNKTYSPETCAFVPREINNLFTKSNSIRGELPIGVTKSDNKFRARFGKDRGHLGLFDTPEEAFYAYKVAKEAYIKKIADKWEGQITEEVYQALINYKVEITD